MSVQTETQPTTAAELDALCVNTIRFLSVDAVQAANSGHPGPAPGCGPHGLRAVDPLPQAQSGAIPAGSIATASCFRPATVRCCSTACCT